MARSRSSLVALVLLACAAFVLLSAPQGESFVVPRVLPSAGGARPSALARGNQAEPRVTGVA
eukprot:CAMPEP_0197888046 /NCGR_PEP_ID=MMETSP1439-20131203/20824_1 /TAXON_ID=66791 /ORGANISM="Gonyaulax spinifera, Strain CCMP409" /LENGTH=61 /DNA_ID=CAMNT_0043507931 /DNA_START=1 /DNA_END=183 /DNA_ORIENTATION=+